MAGGKESPRQKMIGMMYLVLTAMLALNVSNEVLNAFKLVNDGLENTTSNFGQKNQLTLQAFQAAMENNPTKTKPYFDKAKLANQYSAELDKYISEIKDAMVKEAGGRNEKEGNDIVDRQNLDISAEMMVLKGEGDKLKSKILETRKKLIGLADPKDQASINFSLNAVDPPAGRDGLARSWASNQFEGVPVTAAVTLLSKIQTDTKNAESEMLTYLLKSIDAQDFKFDQLEATVVAPTSYVLVGQEYTADVFLTASSSTQAPEIYIGGSRLKVENGKGKYSGSTTKEGLFNWGGVIKVKSPDGTVKDYKFEQTYQVAAPTATVSADKMNVFYIGVDNPVTISGPGVPKEKIRAGISAGTLSGSNGSYTVRVTDASGPKVFVSVSAELKPGATAKLGGKEYRVKSIPDPIAKVGGIATGNLSAGALRVQAGVIADLENFDFDVRYNVTGFNMTVVKQRQDAVRLQSGSAYFTPEMKNALAGVGAKDKVLFDEITARGPDGRNRRLKSGIVINVQ